MFAADLFCDLDLGSVSQSMRVGDYPRGFARIRRELPEVPVMYTGALENYPALLEEFGRGGPLFGNNASTVRCVRDPSLLHRTLRSHGIVSPLVSLHPPVWDPKRKWLNKPLRSAGGFRIRRWKSGEDLQPDAYFQEFISGAARAGSFLAGREGCRLVGISDSYVGCKWAGADGFAYCGSVTHLADAHERQQWQRIGNVLTEHCGLRGLFGVDAIVTDELVWPIEVNPRYTASMELFESSSGISLVAAHVNAFTSVGTHQSRLAADSERVINLDLGTNQDTFGKCILYAGEQLRVPDAFELESQLTSVSLADIPRPGIVVEPRHPILSILANGASKTDVQRKLQATCECLRGQMITMRETS